MSLPNRSTKLKVAFGYIPVSYTHLDVYKRQFPLFRQFLHQQIRPAGNVFHMPCSFQTQIKIPRTQISKSGISEMCIRDSISIARIRQMNPSLKGINNDFVMDRSEHYIPENMNPIFKYRCV